ncbi:hypothetical protein GOP47_0008844 [Adiantum capillus-veneris]|uniref:Exostosin GT47 domain-containing protein n=1 Tax=Adiantum capillus-veneris TaxID=13818 RepID=A0A9D4ZIJ3_ADICA|nr:hypothetical protein GOP47_0008844 [Adiantum capillus-veneris]
MGSKLVSSLASFAACMSLGAIVSYIALSNGVLLQTTNLFSAASFVDRYSKANLPTFSLTRSNGACKCLVQANATADGLTNGTSVKCACDSTSGYSTNQIQVLPSCANGTLTAASPADNKQGSISKESVVKYEPWYAQGRTWHYPVLFPRCSMDVCFNYSRCEGTDRELLIYSYDSPSPPVRYFTGIKDTQWHTDNASKACLFFVFLDLNKPHRPHPRALPYWNNGLNHVLITFADMWKQRGPPQDTIGNASVMASDIHETTYRPGFDISIPLPGKLHMRELQDVKPNARKYLMTFRGLRYLGRAHEEGVLRSAEAFRAMHNGEDVVVVTSCRHGTNNLVRREAPELGVKCEEDEAKYWNYTYKDLMNTTFGLVPAGRQASSYRMIEVLSAGVVPVLVADNYVKPFDTLIQWHRCLLQFPSSEMHRIVPTLRAMDALQLLFRQRYCIHIYDAFLKDDRTLLRTTIASLTARFLGSLPLNIKFEADAV